MQYKNDVFLDESFLTAQENLRKDLEGKLHLFFKIFISFHIHCLDFIFFNR